MTALIVVYLELHLSDDGDQQPFEGVHRDACRHRHRHRHKEGEGGREREREGERESNRGELMGGVK